VQTISQKIYRLRDDIPACATVKPGEVFRVEIQNAFGKSFDNLEEFEFFLSAENETEKKSVNHPCTGPIAVEGATDAHSLAVTILSAKAHRGFQCISKSTGLLRSEFTKRFCSIYDIKDGKYLEFHGGDVVLHANPKVGFISTLDQMERSCGRSSENGGNLDLNFLDEGSVIYLPVNHPTQARIAFGDLHICQGNGEAAGIGIEADGELEVRIDLVDKINFPIIDNRNQMVYVGWGDSLDEGITRAVKNAMTYLERLFPFSQWESGELYKFLSAEGNMTLGNSSGKVKTCGLSLLKKRMKNKYGFPLF